jgi:hypothetical protein
MGASVDIMHQGGRPGLKSDPQINSSLSLAKLPPSSQLFDSMGRILLRIRGYDLAHRLTYGKKTRTYGDANPMAQAYLRIRSFAK